MSNICARRKMSRSNETTPPRNSFPSVWTLSVVMRRQIELAEDVFNVAVDLSPDLSLSMAAASHA